MPKQNAGTTSQLTARVREGKANHPELSIVTATLLGVQSSSVRVHILEVVIPANSL